MWEEELEAREPAEASSQAGRTVTATFQQCKRHTRAFFKQLKTRTMPLDVLSTMVEITSFMQQREYVKAHDAYIRCAIGTAPWPMGITGTGIHERQGRQHLRESKVAHVMNDETQRKYARHAEDGDWKERVTLAVQLRVCEEFGFVDGQKAEGLDLLRSAVALYPDDREVMGSAHWLRYNICRSCPVAVGEIVPDVPLFTLGEDGGTASTTLHEQLLARSGGRPTVILAGSHT